MRPFGLIFNEARTLGDLRAHCQQLLTKMQRRRDAAELAGRNFDMGQNTNGV
jgi:hypothetical protein